MSTLKIEGLHARLVSPTCPSAIVVAAHGLCLNSASWYRTAAILGKTMPEAAILTYDHQDHGRSPRRDPGQRLTVETIAADLATVIEHASTIAPTVIVAGHSLGAMAALSMCCNALAPVDALVLISASSGSLCDHGLLHLVPRPLTRTLPEFAHSHPSAFDLLWRALRPTLSPWLGPQAPHRGCGPRPSAQTLASLLASLRDWDIARSLGPLGTIPTEILVGTGDAITPAAHSRRIADAIDGANLHCVPGGHNLPMEPGGAQACAEAISRAIGRVSNKNAAIHLQELPS